MAPDPRVQAAFQAMKSLGIKKEKVKNVLKKLLRLYDKNWELIEAENYRALADAIFEEDDNVEQEKKNGANHEDDLEREEIGQEPERPLKRLRLRGREVNQVSTFLDTDVETSKLEVDEQFETRFLQQPQNMAEPPEPTDGGCSSSPQHGAKNKGKQPMISEPEVPRQRLGLISSPGKRPLGVCLREPIAEPGSGLFPIQTVPNHQLIKPKDEPFTDDMLMDEIPHYEVPIAVIHPEPESAKDMPMENDESSKENGNESPSQVKDGKKRSDDPMLMENDRSGKEIGKESSSQCKDGGRGADGIASPCGETGTNVGLATIQGEPSSNLDVATSPLGEVKLSLSCNSAVRRPNFCMPKLEAVIRLTEEKCLHSYKITDPNFSVMKLLRHVCESFLELGTDSIDKSQDDHHLQASEMTLSNGSAANDIDSQQTHVNACGMKPTAWEPEDLELTNLTSLVVVPPCELAPNDLRSRHNINDIAKGEEKVRIPWINEMNNESPPSFHYISQSLVFNNAEISISLSRIGDLSCCPTCLGDCLSASIPCSCSRETGGEFAYASAGALKEVFLQECISMTRDPQQQCQVFCGECPLEKSKNDVCLETCKGHLKRNFIKECWSKCGCNKQCGNRVMQRGITCNLQVFFTPEGKGWGLRTLQDLPKGTFVCEYVGEIMTGTELYERNMECDKSGNDTYLALLDADWASITALKNEKALCLDASRYGNVARFINHRCLDANLIEIPVEVETPDHHYYHLAFFTTRDVDAMEELTWDYGIDFDDHDHPIKPFQCRCGSKFCRNMKRPNRSKSTSISS